MVGGSWDCESGSRGDVWLLGAPKVARLSRRPSEEAARSRRRGKTKPAFPGECDCEAGTDRGPVLLSPVCHLAPVPSAQAVPARAAFPARRLSIHPEARGRGLLPGLFQP